jgi:predicted nucleic acid-binding protein
MKNTYLIDTNIIVYAFNVDSKYHEKSLKIIEDSLNGIIDASIAEKTLYEFFAVVTDERRVEFPLSINEAKKIINVVLSSKIKILYSNNKSLNKSLDIAEKYLIKKQDIFDLVLVGIMIENEIENIITVNDKHFKIIDEINVINPFIENG